MILFRYFSNVTIVFLDYTLIVILKKMIFILNRLK